MKTIEIEVGGTKIVYKEDRELELLVEDITWDIGNLTKETTTEEAVEFFIPLYERAEKESEKGGKYHFLPRVVATIMMRKFVMKKMGFVGRKKEYLFAPDGQMIFGDGIDELPFDGGMQRVYSQWKESILVDFCKIALQRHGISHHTRNAIEAVKF